MAKPTFVQQLAEAVLQLRGQLQDRRDLHFADLTDSHFNRHAVQMRDLLESLGRRDEAQAIQFNIITDSQYNEVRGKLKIVKAQIDNDRILPTAVLPLAWTFYVPHPEQIVAEPDVRELIRYRQPRVDVRALDPESARLYLAGVASTGPLGYLKKYIGLYFPEGNGDNRQTSDPLLAAYLGKGLDVADGEKEALRSRVSRGESSGALTPGTAQEFMNRLT